uniref:EF-hand domain-containing protein n=1 Tax=Araucaria cunninghamii TaxID=56994 RepID=A0A0D6QSK6_ARACU
MALSKAVGSVSRSSAAARTFCRPLTSSAERDCRQQTESGASARNGTQGTLMRWASGLAVAAGLGLMQISSFEGGVADCSSNEAERPVEGSKSNFPFPRIFSVSGSNGNEDGIHKRLEGRQSRYVFSDSYRRRVFFNYEKRIRMRSSPEKVFEYFASRRSPKGELFMTSADLMRAVVPVFPPSDSNIIRDGFLNGERSPGELTCPPSKFFMFFDTDGDGLISFPEYIFFVTLLSVPESDMLAVFKMFDLDHDGKINRDEFKQVMKLMRARNRQGAAHRDGHRTGFKVEESVDNGGLVEYFFGKDGKGHLQLEDFKSFIRDLHKEIIHLEFQHYDHQSCGTISAKDFALSMVASADMNCINQYLDRVDVLSNDPYLGSVRVTDKEFRSFVDLRKKLQVLALAMSTYGKVYGLLTKTDFQRAASHVCDISISDNLVDIIFYIFDTNSDGSLSINEFLGVLDRRERDITYPRDHGIVHMLTSWWLCAKHCRSECGHP